MLLNHDINYHNYKKLTSLDPPVKAFFMYNNMEEEELRLRKLGTEKRKKFDENFDELSVKYEKLAVDDGYDGDIKYIVEKGKVLIYVVL